jgi:hypothetical protein
MRRLVMSSGISGYGPSVRIRMVCGSTISTARIGRVKMAKEDGLFGTVGTRSKVKATSSAVNGLPLWKRTSRRSLNSQRFGSTARHSVARPGIGRDCPSVPTSLSKIMSATALLGESWW